MKFLEILLQFFEWIVIIVDAAFWLDWLMLDFLKQLTRVSFDTALHDDTKCFIAWRILIFGSGLLLTLLWYKGFLSLLSFEALRDTLVHWLKNRRFISRQENQVDVRKILDFRMNRTVVNQKGNLSALSSKGLVAFSYPVFK